MMMTYIRTLAQRTSFHLMVPNGCRNKNSLHTMAIEMISLGTQ